jgi:hypothetical protein
MGWSWVCFFLGPIWYLKEGLTRKGLILIALVLVTAGLGLPAICFYCGFRGKRDLYEKELRRRSVYSLGDIDSRNN